MGINRRVVFGFLVASGLALPARLVMAANVWTIPGTVNAGGQNNTRFVSDLAVTNPGSAAAVLTISLLPANGTVPSQITLVAGETVVYRNLLDRVWGAQGSGARRSRATRRSSSAPGRTTRRPRERTAWRSLFSRRRSCFPPARWAIACG